MPHSCVLCAHAVSRRDRTHCNVILLLLYRADGGGETGRAWKPCKNQTRCFLPRRRSDYGTRARKPRHRGGSARRSACGLGRALCRRSSLRVRAIRVRPHMGITRAAVRYDRWLIIGNCDEHAVVGAANEPRTRTGARPYARVEKYNARVEKKKFDSTDYSSPSSLAATDAAE